MRQTVNEQEYPSELVVEDEATSDNDNWASTENTLSSTAKTLKKITTIKITNINKKRRLAKKTKEEVNKKGGCVMLKTASALVNRVINAESTPKEEKKGQR